MPPKLNRRRAEVVLSRIDAILAWEAQHDNERDTRFVELGKCLCEVRAGQYWRLENLKSFDEFLERRFPESRRKAYYLMSIHEHLPPQVRKDLKQVGWTKGVELAKLARKQGQRFESATWMHKARQMPKEEFRREVEKELTGRDSEPSELIYFKVYKSQIPVIEQAIETAALMLGSDKSRGYCLEMICADFLAGAHIDGSNPELLLQSISRYYKFLPTAATGDLSVDGQSAGFMTAASRQESRESDSIRESYSKLHRQVLQRDGWRCQFCGSMQHLQVHHLRVSKPLGQRLRREPDHLVCGLPCAGYIGRHSSSECRRSCGLNLPAASDYTRDWGGHRAAIVVNCSNPITVMFELRCSEFRNYAAVNRHLQRPRSSPKFILRDSSTCSSECNRCLILLSNMLLRAMTWYGSEFRRPASAAPESSDNAEESCCTNRACSST